MSSCSIWTRPSTVRIAALLLSLAGTKVGIVCGGCIGICGRPYAPNQLRISMDTLPYQQNLAELQLTNLSEQMRLLYVAMTRAETKLYLVGKGSQEGLDKRQWGKSQQGRLSASLRSQLNNFQDWLYAIQAVFSDENLAYETRFVTDEG